MTKSATAGRWRMDAADLAQITARAAFGLCGLIAAITLIAALRMYVPLFDGTSKPSAAPSLDATVSRWTPVPSEADLAEPVRVANPFDASEVFEFPQGTAPADARAAVAEMLLERARARYAQLDARTVSH